MTRFAALDQPQRAVLHEPAQRVAHGFHGEAKIPRQPNNGKMKARLAVKAAVPEKMVVNGPVGGGEAQTRGKSALELLADEFGVGLFGFHDEFREMEWSAKEQHIVHVMAVGGLVFTGLCGLVLYVKRPKKEGPGESKPSQPYLP